MTRIAAVDCGTNSIRLLISDVTRTGNTPSGISINEVTRRMEIVRLGQSVDATGELAAEAIARTREALRNYVNIMKFENVEKVRMVATAAVRDAKNNQAFFDMTAELLGEIEPGVSAEVITGVEEAELSFLGAVQDLSAEAGPFCVIDLGGGSTEFIVSKKGEEILGAHSAAMGCVRITERMLPSDPPSETEVEIADDFVAERMSEVEKLVPINQARTVVGCAGTFTTLSALAQGLEQYDPEQIHGSVLRFDALRVLLSQVIATSAAARAQNPVVHPGRADVLGGGAVAVRGIMDMIERHSGVREFVISEKDILDGVIWKQAEAVSVLE
ncbi:Ppx/GppA phosphatase family protein [Corynebacterium pseudodiphtheriticum]|uniref:Ppx/GppA phosphatase family protein n=1 Tax=Corynebacterium pseudodiphtheriticum TaxID=37637 RepID=UPI00234DA527|nr:Ppx/GppA phosphatase family protein [Corynebacterium pseudodiphtheriticum]MDC7088509.1 Ppx/GppA phosphatase family protein [Corynebacterium pseudodiphtheriticum]MDK4320842.1 Ppx/GppA phosphatase family protein [Corynebacterium pseudodiphtheriticum]